jgi:Ni,Fe-hydrogenase III large subunit
VLLKTNSHIERLEATGIVTQDTAHRLALVGPVARASSCNLDSRRDHPFAPYDVWKPRVPVHGSGDALARLQVFAEEIAESKQLILALLDEAGEGRAEVGRTAGTALGWAESARGEALAWVARDTEGKVRGIRLRPASVRNWRAFGDAVRAQNVFTDVPIIEASFGLTVAGIAR